MGTNHFMPNNIMEYFPRIMSKPATRYMWKDFIKIYNRLDYVTAPTHVALKMIKDLGLKTPSQVISNGIDLNEFKRVKIDETVYNKFHLIPKIPIFLFVGRLEKDKNIDIILRALVLNRGKADIQMVIVGEGKDEFAFRKLADDLKLTDRITFTGKISDHDLKQLYTIANVYIGSGGAELQGLAVMEAMAHGLPVLAANAVALPELVKDGVNGYLFELNPQDLAEKMLRILQDSKKMKSMADESLRLIQYHSKDNTLKSFEELYGKIQK
jgi:1,2-diacylglycerol 3-alpha-glucosyltransferase